MAIRALGLATATILALGAVPAGAETLSIYEATLTENNDRAPEVSTTQLRAILADSSALILDTRSRAEFDAGHIPTARLVEAAPKDHVAAVDKLVNGKKSAALVLYCNGPFCQASRRLAEQLADAGFTNLKRYQLGIPVWRALGGPTEIELAGIARIFKADQTAVFIDGRSAEEFAKGTLPGAHSMPTDDMASGKLKKLPLPEDDFNRRVVLFGRDTAQARKLADLLSKRPWHNVAYYPGSFETLAAAVNGK